MHIQSIDTQIIRRQVDGFEHLLQREMLAITIQHYLVWGLLHF